MRVCVTIEVFTGYVTIINDNLTAYVIIAARIIKQFNGIDSFLNTAIQPNGIATLFRGTVSEARLVQLVLDQLLTITLCSHCSPISEILRYRFISANHKFLRRRYCYLIGNQPTRSPTLHDSKSHPRTFAINLKKRIDRVWIVNNKPWLLLSERGHCRTFYLPLVEAIQLF